MKPLVIFDMDGVLVDSEPVHMRLERQIFAQLSLSISESEHHGFVGMAPQAMWADIKLRFDLPQPVSELVALESTIKVREIGRMQLAPIDGVERLIRAFADEGYGLAIASSSSKTLIDTVTGESGCGGLFSQKVSAEEVARGKPHPDIFLRAAELCGRTPVQCVVIEDSGNGVRAATAAGMRCIAYRNENSGHQDLSNADLLVEDFGEAGRRTIMRFLRSTAC